MNKKIFLPLMATVILAGAMFFAGCEKEKNASSSNNDIVKSQLFDANISVFSFCFADTIVIGTIICELPEYDSSYCVIYSSNNNYVAELFTPTSLNYNSYNHFSEQYFEDEGQPLAMLFASNHIKTSNEGRFERWVTRKLKQGKVVRIRYENGVWYGEAFICDDEWQDCLCL